MSVVPFTLEGFETTPFTSSSGRTRDVYRTGNGPAVIIIHEVPGITLLVAAFGRKVAARGMTAVLPDLLGTPGKPVTLPYNLSSLARACVSREFTLLALNKTSPIVDLHRWSTSFGLRVASRHQPPSNAERDGGIPAKDSESDPRAEGGPEIETGADRSHHVGDLQGHELHDRVADR